MNTLTTATAPEPTTKKPPLMVQISHGYADVSHKAAHQLTLSDVSGDNAADCPLCGERAYHDVTGWDKKTHTFGAFVICVECGWKQRLAKEAAAPPACLPVAPEPTLPPFVLTPADGGHAAREPHSPQASYADAALLTRRAANDRAITTARMNQIALFGTPDTNPDGTIHEYSGTIDGLPFTCTAHQMKSDVLLTLTGKKWLEQIINGRTTRQAVACTKRVLVTGGQMQDEGGNTLSRDDKSFGFAADCVLLVRIDRFAFAKGGC